MVSASSAGRLLVGGVDDVVVIPVAVVVVGMAGVVVVGAVVVVGTVVDDGWLNGAVVLVVLGVPEMRPAKSL